MGLFGNKKKEKEQEPTPEVGTEDQNEGLQTYMMEPSLQETHDLMQAVLAEAEQVVMSFKSNSSRRSMSRVNHHFII